MDVEFDFDFGRHDVKEEDNRDQAEWRRKEVKEAEEGAS